jgi:Acetyltransferase (GNAT) domain
VATELIQDYLPDQAPAWDDLVARAVNGTMLHTRRYLSYHGERFRDRSLLITNSRGWPIGALPAAEDPADASVVTSHPGLTYGGLVHDGSLRGESMMRVLSQIAAHYRALGFARLQYKALPQIYQAEPAADDVHALYRLGASQSSCDLAAVINLAARGRVATSRRQRRRRAEAAGVQVDEGWKDATSYWQVLEANLGRRHGATPTHSLAEIEYLHDRFPKEIILITAKIGDDLVGGNLFTAEGPVLQVRYTATTEAGRDACATDLVVERGIALAAELDCRYFSFGTSTLDAGRELNAPQYDFKVSFGAGGVTHDAYELSLEDAPIPGHRG